MPTDEVAAWHYTVGEHLLGIISSGVIRPATVPKGERPVVWLSTLRSWEPTATKGMRSEDGDVQRDATDEEMEGLLGRWRLGVGPDFPLGDWPAFRRKAGMDGVEADAFAAAARAKGADPSLWRVSWSRVPLRAVVAIERLVNDEWIPGERGDDGWRLPFSADENAKIFAR